MKKILINMSILMIVLLTFAGCENKSNVFGDNKGKIKVAVTFNAMREFTEAVGQDKVNILTIIPDGTEPHDFEPKAKDLASISQADVFVYNGLGLEKWVDNSLDTVGNSKLTVVEASKNAKGIKEGKEYDPHIWLSLTGAIKEIEAIRDGLIKVDEKNKAFYSKNAEVYISKLNELYSVNKIKFEKLTNKKFVTGHAAFAYLCKDFSLEQNSVEDVFAEGEPSAKQLETLTKYCKDNNIKTVFVESMVSPKVSNTLANEVGAKTEKIYTLEAKEDGKDYYAAMKYNIEKIYESLSESSR